MKTEIIVHNLFSSPKHNYFTRKKFNVGDAPTVELEEVELIANQGIKGDRFEFSKYPLTFFSLEVAQEVCSCLNLELNVKLFRRNVVVSGIHLNSLIGKRFFINGIEFEGLAHCNPCPWMNAVMKKGVYAQMKGRGGLRAKVIGQGLLNLGKAELSCDANLEANPLEALKTPKIPSY